MRDSRAIDVYAPPAEEAKVVASNMYIGDGFTSTNIYIYIRCIKVDGQSSPS